MYHSTQTKDQTLRSTKLIFYLLTFIPLFYVFLLLLIQEFAITPDPTIDKDPIYRTLLPAILLGISFLEVILVYKYFLPLFEENEDFDQSFGLALVPITLIEAIAVYGLLIGVLQAFAESGFIEWLQVLTFNGLSVLFNYHIVTHRILPKMQKMKEEKDLQSFNS